VAWAGDRFAVAGLAIAGIEEGALIARGLPDLAAPAGPVVTPQPAATTAVAVERTGRATLHLASGLDLDLEGEAVCTGARGGALTSVRANDVGSVAGYRIRLELLVAPLLELTIYQGHENAPEGTLPMEYATGEATRLAILPGDAGWSGSAEFAGLVGQGDPEMAAAPIGGEGGPTTLDGRLSWTCGDEPVETGTGRLDGTLALEGPLGGSFTITGECLGDPPSGVVFGEGTLTDGRDATLQLDFYEDSVGIQVLPADAGKEDAPHAVAPVTLVIEATSPTAGRFEATFDLAGGTVTASATFRCNR
jgi:hypothetical protein